MLSAAYHEVSHALIARELGYEVFGICLHRDASGYADVAHISSPIKNLRITVAGYVGERVMFGYNPSYAAMKRDITQAGDTYEVKLILLDGRVRGDIAVPAAIQYVKDFLAIPSNKKRVQQLAKRLVRTRVLYAHNFR
jgi:hypothetical protein